MTIGQWIGISRTIRFTTSGRAYRTRKEPKIELETRYEYKEAGKYQVVVKVIDILGNDTTKTVEVVVK